MLFPVNRPISGQFAGGFENGIAGCRRERTGAVGFALAFLVPRAGAPQSTSAFHRLIAAMNLLPFERLLNGIYRDCHDQKIHHRAALRRLQKSHGDGRDRYRFLARRDLRI